MSKFAECIAELRALARLPEDFDGEGSVAPSQALVERADNFLSDCASRHLDLTGLPLPMPWSVAGDSRGIDLHWKTTTAELLARVPTDYFASVSFYGDDRGVSDKIEGTLDPAGDIAWFALWIGSHLSAAPIPTSTPKDQGRLVIGNPDAVARVTVI